MPSQESEDSDAARELRLVRKAILSLTTPCFEWEERATRDVRSRCDGLQPSTIKQLVIDFVSNNGRINQQFERDENWKYQRQFDHYYSICMDVDGIDAPIYVKIILLKDDEDLPEARIVGAHKSSF